MHGSGNARSATRSEALIVATGASLSLALFAGFGAYDRLPSGYRYPTSWVWGFVIFALAAAAGAATLFVREWRRRNGAGGDAASLGERVLASLAAALLSLIGAAVVLFSILVGLFLLSLAPLLRVEPHPQDSFAPAWTRTECLFLSLTIAGIAASFGALCFTSRLMARRYGGSVAAAIALAGVPAVVLIAVFYAASSEAYRCHVIAYEFRAKAVFPPFEPVIRANIPVIDNFHEGGECSYGPDG